MNRILETAYIAGVLDSDGWFTIHKNIKQSMNPIYSPRMGINQAESEAVDLAKKLFGGKFTMVDHGDRYGHGRPLHCWVLGSDGLIEGIEELLPHLRIKKTHALCCLLLQANIREWKKIRPVRGRIGESPIPDGIHKEREMLYNTLRMLHDSTVAETERQDIASSLDSLYVHYRRDDATVRTRRMENAVQP